MASIALNARFYSHTPTGMQRYGIEMAERMSDMLDVLRPDGSLRGAKGHLWEQMYLPAKTGGRLLWSPNNTGPLAVGRQVCTIHDIIPIEHPEWFNRNFSSWYQWLLPKLVHRVLHIITVSQFTKDRLCERFKIPSHKISVIWNGVDESFRPSSEEEIQAMRIDAGIPQGRYILSLGSLEPRKNLRRLLAAWELLFAELPEDVHLVIAGSKGDSLVFADNSLGPIPPRVHFAGYVAQTQLPALYSGALALVYPSLYEGFGLPPLEAMACGCPVVTSNNTSLLEVVNDAALLVDPFNIESIAEGIFRMFMKPRLREELRTRGFYRAAGVTWDRAASETRNILMDYRNA